MDKVVIHDDNRTPLVRSLWSCRDPAPGQDGDEAASAQSADQSLASSNCQSVTWTQLHLYWTADIQIGDYLRYLLQQFSETVPIPTTSVHIVPFSKCRDSNSQLGMVCLQNYVFQVKYKSEYKYLIDKRWNKIISSLNRNTEEHSKENSALFVLWCILSYPRSVDSLKAMSGHRAGEE